MRDIQRVLECWGGWAASGHGSIYYSPIAAGFKGLLSPTSKSRPSCCDNDGIAVDGAVGRLIKVGRKDEFELIELHYIHDISKSEIARQKKCSEGKIRQKLMVAETFIEACLIMTEVTLEMDV
ncbi:antiterminator Q family protein [Xenorhabdus lircayensis]|uniref:Antitermination protein n=1 Tax=Xenorhabdus lircayensis TaxID=2763499 RepID=A0ABS0UBK1_9GAMM|nr:antiterminator Q family protein [Xenorhabdus lircayensis]MBI6550146.1 antitermination protein [Xenorhabdus lircayensis]